ncbi:MAG: hypothetical protein DRP74_00890 [Candidatus Omnitrophota bacterium]|nr:MAG: hypothetical protein DRP74_00890 [Candidatus Omnitrophota bacterium]
MLKHKLWVVAGTVISLLMMLPVLSFSQSLESGIESVEEDTGIEAEPDSDTLWLWGEILAVNPEKKELKIKYLDYDSYNEKETLVIINEDTTYENVNSFDEIKPQDTISLDYITDSSGVNIAKNISVERLGAIGGEEEQEYMQEVTETNPEEIAKDIELETQVSE